MKRVAERQKRGSVVVGLDPAIGRYFAAGPGTEFDPVYFAQSSLVTWLNGFDKVEDWIKAGHASEERAKLKKILRVMYPDGKILARGHSAESRDRILHLLEKVRSKMEDVREYAKKPDATKFSSSDVWPLFDVTALMRRYATYPALVFHPATGAFGVAHQALGARGEPWDPGFEIVMFMAQEEERDLRRKAALYDQHRASLLGKSVSKGCEGNRTVAAGDGAAGVHSSELGAIPGSGSVEHGDDVGAQSLNVGGVPDGEILAGYAVIELARLGKLNLVRQCVCGNWMFVTRSDKKCCSDNCRHKIYEQTPAYKQRRRDIAKKNYISKRDKGVGAFDADRKAVKKASIRKVAR